MTPSFSAFPVHADADLERERLKAIDNFVRLRRKESHTLYPDTWNIARQAVDNLFATTADLTKLSPDAFLPDDPTRLGRDRAGHERIAAWRFMCGVPVSADDLKTMVGLPLGQRVLSPSVRQSIIDAVQPELDEIRLPWLFEAAPRRPTAVERERAVAWTAGLMATERRRTARRVKAATLQELCVAKILIRLGFKYGDRKSIGSITLASDLPKGQFLTETNVAGDKCDVPVRLWDGRLLAIECKSSNSAVNSYKRLTHEVGNKARKWHAVFGQAVVVGAVVAGVYDMRNLKNAQDTDVTIFWQHRLRVLIDAVEAAR